MQNTRHWGEIGDEQLIAIGLWDSSRREGVLMCPGPCSNLRLSTGHGLQKGVGGVVGKKVPVGQRVEKVAE